MITLFMSFIRLVIGVGILLILITAYHYLSGEISSLSVVLYSLAFFALLAVVYEAASNYQSNTWFTTARPGDTIREGLFYAVFESGHKPVDLPALAEKINKEGVFQVKQLQENALHLHRKGNFVTSMIGETITLSTQNGRLKINSRHRFFPFPVFDFGRNLKNIKQVLAYVD